MRGGQASKGTEEPTSKNKKKKKASKKNRISKKGN
jgi:hypothetical protein